MTILESSAMRQAVLCKQRSNITVSIIYHPCYVANELVPYSEGEYLSKLMLSAQFKNILKHFFHLLFELAAKGGLLL